MLNVDWTLIVRHALIVRGGGVGASECLSGDADIKLVVPSAFPCVSVGDAIYRSVHPGVFQASVLRKR